MPEMGQAHKTNDCPTKEKIPNPTCINCKGVGHMANWHECPTFTKVKAKKGDASQNRNSQTQLLTSKPVNSNFTFANALKPSQQREPLDRSKSVISETEAPKTHTVKTTPPPPPRELKNRNQDENFTFMDAVKEIKTLFKEFPYLLELGKALKAAKQHEKVDVFYQYLFHNA
ncbi:hypothetical protein TNCV_2456331 [Trichonephila clavipes]|nr:hypothetical protein TNCV_2456331 [Trichonephila clavipes]